jgi:hypothetical protein
VSARSASGAALLAVLFALARERVRGAVVAWRVRRVLDVRVGAAVSSAVSSSVAEGASSSPTGFASSVPGGDAAVVELRRRPRPPRRRRRRGAAAPAMGSPTTSAVSTSTSTSTSVSWTPVASAWRGSVSPSMAVDDACVAARPLPRRPRPPRRRPRRAPVGVAAPSDEASMVAGTRSVSPGCASRSISGCSPPPLPSSDGSSGRTPVAVVRERPRPPRPRPPRERRRRGGAAASPVSVASASETSRVEPSCASSLTPISSGVVGSVMPSPFVQPKRWRAYARS